MDFHPIAELFPLMEQSEFEKLVDDIAENGQREAIWLHPDDNTIIDGRNRYMACCELGVVPEYRTWDGNGSLVSFVVSLNLHRRHLTASQKAAIASTIKPMFDEEARERQGARNDIREIFPESSKGRSRDQAAAVTGANPRYVSDYEKIEREAPDLAAPIRSGKINIPTAKILAEVDREERDEIVARGRDEIMAEARRIKAGDNNKRRAEKEAERERLSSIAIPANLSDRYNIYHCGVETLQNYVEPNSVDWIITDPPYPREFLHTYADLASFASYALKEGGSLLAMSGQSYLPEIHTMLGSKLIYHWTLAYTTFGGQSPQIWPRKVNTFWKPILWYTKGEYRGSWIGDVAKSDVNDKRFHHWGQSESGFFNLCEKFVKRGDVVCDPFLGGGTTAVIALELGAYFIGCDIDKAEVGKTILRLTDE